MVRRGWSAFYTKYGLGRFPDEFRRAEREASPQPTPPASAQSPAQPADDECLIKGNISKNGRIYHVPGSRSYAATKINDAKGERWFCSEEAARAAGWRAPR